MIGVQLALSSSTLCRGCCARSLCDEGTTARGCSDWGPTYPTLLHPSNPDWLVRLAEINGFGFDDILARDQTVSSLPRYAPRIRLGSGIASYEGVPAVALSLREAERLAAKMRTREVSAKRILGVPESSLLIVLGFESDDYLEEVWPQSRRQRVLDAIGLIGPDLAVAWGYSLWHRHAAGWTYPRVENLYSMKRSLLVFAEMQRLGIAAVPHVYWGNGMDLNRWGRWFRDNPSVTMLAVDLQTVDSAEDWETALQGLAQLRHAMPRSLHLLANGPCVPERIRQLEAVWPGFTLTNFAARFCAMLVRKPMYRLQAAWIEAGVISRQEVFRLASIEYEDILANRAPICRSVDWSRRLSGGAGASQQRFVKQSSTVPRYVSSGAVQLALPEVDPIVIPRTIGVA